MVKAMETSLRELLEGTKQYQVPLYQRRYSWRKDNLTRLWDDVLKPRSTDGLGLRVGRGNVEVPS